MKYLKQRSIFLQNSCHIYKKKLIKTPPSRFHGRRFFGVLIRHESAHELFVNDDDDDDGSKQGDPVGQATP